MGKVSRDVLIVSRLACLSEQALEEEMLRVNRMLHQVETLHYACQATEVLDVARYKIIRKPQKVLSLLRSAPLKPFVFVFNRN